MQSTRKRALAILATAALAFAGVAATATAANAAALPGTITLYSASTGATRGPAITNGTVASAQMFRGISVNGTCPAANRDGVVVTAFQGGVLKGALSSVQIASDAGFGFGGFNSTNIAKSDADLGGNTNVYVSDKPLNGITNYASMVDGSFEVRYYCMADQSQFTAADPYYTLTLTLNKTAGTWTVPVALTPTTTSLTAAAQPDNTVQLSATIKNGAATATTAGGTVSFSDGGTPLVGCTTVSLTLGVANCTTAVLSNGNHVITATYTGDTTFATSTSDPATVTVGAYGTLSGNVTVSVPDNQGALTLTGTVLVNMGGATKNAALNVFEAAGNLGPLVVTDTRQTGKPSWNLNGQVANLVSGSNTIDKKYLGWLPSVAAGSVGTAGPLVAPLASGTGLGASRLLATGAVPTDPTVSTTTTASAVLSLSAPGNTPAGSYAGLLTITLV